MYTSPAKLAYRGVLIERPCANCDTVDIHFQGRCNSGPCAVCGAPRHTTNRVGQRHHDWDQDHPWVAQTYYPADFESPPPAFDALVDHARSLGLPELFTCDLFRDYQIIKRESVRKFIWGVRDTGSDIIYLKDGGAYSHMSQSGNDWYWYDGVNFWPVSLSQGVHMLNGGVI